jgi:Na+-translocating ferredoxin:NAD+ oxidoreductase RnfG subunit
MVQRFMTNLSHSAASIHRPARRPRLGLVALLAVLGLALPAAAAEYWSAKSVLGSFFKGVAQPSKVTFKHVVLSDAEATEIGKQLGTGPVKRDWSIYFTQTDDKRDERFGLAIVGDNEIGLHEPIDFAVHFSSAGAVDRVEIMAYREAYGEEVRSERFRQQFVGKTARDAITAGKDIDVVSGASYSSKSVALGVKRDTLVLSTALKNGAL